MDIKDFQQIATAGLMGRLRIDETEDRVVAPNTTRAGKTLARIGDFFKRATNSGKTAQANQNRDVRQVFAQALRRAYPQSGDRFAQEIQKTPTKPLMMREMKALLSQARLENIRESIRLEVPHTGRSVGVSAVMIPNSTLQQVPDLETKLQEKIQRGHDLVASLRTNRGEVPEHASIRDVSDIMWFLQVSGQAKEGKPFREGAITVDDPGGRIRGFLDSCPEVYQRKSSHIGGFQKQTDGAHRGIDIKGEANALDTLLPNGRATVLYGRVPKGVQGMPREMLFVKMEGHGCRLASPSSKIRQTSPDAPASRKIRFADIKDGLSHGLSFVGGIGQRFTGKQPGGSRKERIDGVVSKGFQKVVDALPREFKGPLMKDDPLGKSGGIRVMLNNIDNVREELRRFAGEEVNQGDQMHEIDLDEPVHEPVNVERPQPPRNQNVVSELFPEGTFVSSERLNEIDILLDTFQNLLMKRYESDLDNIGSRIGNEVILGQNDLPNRL